MVVDEKEIVVQEEIKENRVKVVQKEEKVQKEKVVEDVTEEETGRQASPPKRGDRPRRGPCQTIGIEAKDNETGHHSMARRTVRIIETEARARI